MKTRKARVTSKFENRVRFNWGFHDAVQVVREGWQRKNYGFGPALKIESPEDVLARHFDRVYARGWIMGYYEAVGRQSGGADLNNMSSEVAWNDAMRQGKVAA